MCITNMDKVLQALFLCHRLPERSFFFRGKQFPICARCTGILVGYFIGILYFFIIGKISMLVSLLLLIPLIVDGVGQFFGKWISTNPRRLITGILAGVATDFIIYWIAVYGFTHGQQLARILLT